MTKTDIEIMDDGAFSVYKTRWGTYSARDKEGNGLCVSLDKEATIFWAREHLNNFPNSYATSTNVSMVGDSLKND